MVRPRLWEVELAVLVGVRVLGDEKLELVWNLVELG